MEGIYTLCKGRDSDKQTTKLHFRYASHEAFRYKTDCETRYIIILINVKPIFHRTSFGRVRADNEKSFVLVTFQIIV